jgi:hypothetical protein
MWRSRTDEGAATMADKSLPKHNTKKVGKSLKDKRAAKKAKKVDKKPLI